MKYKHYISSNTNIYYNLAMEQYLMSMIDDNISILFLWQNDNTVVIGRNQRAETECNLKEMTNDNCLLARRQSGGGAVYHDLGNLCFSIISKNASENIISGPVLIKDTLMSLGFRSIKTEKNDILVNGKKISGLADYSSRSGKCQHGTVLIDTNKEKMSRFLTPSKNKLRRNHVESIGDRVLNLRELNKELSIEKLMEGIVKTVESSELFFEEEAELFRGLKLRASSRRWIYEGKN